MTFDNVVLAEGPNALRMQATNEAGSTIASGTVTLDTRSPTILPPTRNARERPLPDLTAHAPHWLEPSPPPAATHQKKHSRRRSRDAGRFLEVRPPDRPAAAPRYEITEPR